MNKIAKKQKNIKVSDTLLLTGGIVTIFAGLMSLFLGSSVEYWFLHLSGAGISLWGIICGIIMLVGYTISKDKKKRNIGFSIALIISILALITFQGWIIGPLLGIIGSIVGIIYPK